MLIQDTAAPVSKVNVDSPVVDFHVDAANTQHIVYMMVNMYKDPLLAVVRELMSNAADEHVRLGLTQKFKVILPNNASPTFVVRDYAEGLPEEEVYRLITGIGSSGSYKRQDVHTTGGFGIGAKCPATITDQWMITSHHGGIKKVYSAFKGPTGNLQLTKLGETPTDESGLEVSVPIDKRYLEDIKHRFLLAMQAYQPEERPEIIGINSQLLDETRPAFEGENVQFYSDKNTRYGYGASLIVNRVKYPIDTAQFADGDKQVNFWLMNDICIRITDAAEKAVINVTPSREALIYTPQLKQLIITKLWNVGSIFQTEIQKKLDLAVSFTAAQQIRHQFSGRYHRYMADDMLPLTFRGREFKFTDALDFTRALDTQSAFWIKTLPELYKMAKLSLESRLYPGVFGYVVKSRPNSCLGFGARVMIPITSDFTWYINDIPETWKHFPRKYINAIKELNTNPGQRFVIVNDIPGFLDHLNTFFPDLSKNFVGRFSQIRDRLPKKERVSTPRVSDGTPAVKRVKMEVIGSSNAKFCRIDEEALAQGEARGIPTWAIKSLTGKTIYTVLDNMVNPEWAFGYSDGKVVNVRLKPDYYRACRSFAETFNKAAGIQANLISVSKSYYESAGVPDGWVQLHDYVKTEIPAQLKTKKHSKLFAELLDLAAMLLFETHSGMWQGPNTVTFSSQNGLPAVELIKLISEYADNNPNLKFKNSKIRDICAEFNRRTRAITLGIISKHQMSEIMNKVLSTSRYQANAEEIRNFFKLTESEFEDITKSKVWDQMVNSACDTDLDFKLAMLATYIEANSPRSIYKTAFKCADKIKTVMISKMFKPKQK